MFDIGFWEICMVGLISLLVIGPERLPKAARLAGFWVGKSQRIIASVKQEISQELKDEELRQLIKEQNLVADLKQVHNEINSASTTLTSAAKQLAENTEQSKPRNEGN